jgi:hypothetical protein
VVLGAVFRPSSGLEVVSGGLLPCNQLHKKKMRRKPISKKKEAARGAAASHRMFKATFLLSAKILADASLENQEKSKIRISR